MNDSYRIQKQSLVFGSYYSNQSFDRKKKMKKRQRMKKT